MIERVKVGGVTYTVKEEDIVEIDGNYNYAGSCTYSATTIELSKRLSHERKTDVFVHELVHAIMNEAGYDDHDEELVTRVSKVLCQVLRDNDFSWMREEEESDE